MRDIERDEHLEMIFCKLDEQFRLYCDESTIARIAHLLAHPSEIAVILKRNSEAAVNLGMREVGLLWGRLFKKMKK
jgi:hypothetical protein